MFERYTEKARRVIFFARYEASQFGSPYIETEHLLLGLLREDKFLTNRFLRSHSSIESIRKQVEAHTPTRAKISTSVDMPLSEECKRVLAYAAEEAVLLTDKHIGTEHLLLGLLREEKSFAAQILSERGLSLEAAHEELKRAPARPEPPVADRPEKPSIPEIAERIREALGPEASGRFLKPSLAEYSRDLTQAALEGRLDPLVGREAELEQIIQTLSRRSKNNPLLIGEPGVGKSAIVDGLAQRIADGQVPVPLADKRLLALDLSPLLAGVSQLEQRLKPIIEAWTAGKNLIVFIEDLLAPGGGRNALEVVNSLRPALTHRQIQCIGSATSGDFEKALAEESWLEQCFYAVKISPPGEDEAIRILSGIKDRYEKFHGVTYTDEAIQYAVRHSNRYIPGRHLPDKAIDLMDEAGAAIKLWKGALPQDILDAQKRLSFIKRRLESDIGNIEPEKVRFYQDEERKEGEKLRQLLEKHGLPAARLSTVTLDDIEQIVARWTGVPLETIQRERSSPANPSS